MNSAEFKTWWDKARVILPALTIWVRKLSDEDEVPKDLVSSVAIIRHWRALLVGVTLEDANAVLDEIVNGKLDPIGSTDSAREMFGKTIRNHCRQREFDRKRDRDRAVEAQRPVTVMKPRVVEGRISLGDLIGKTKEEIAAGLSKLGIKVQPRAYSCLACKDGFWVSVWHPQDLQRLASDPEWKPRYIHTAACFCTCDRAEDHWAPGNRISRYKPKDHCIYEDALSVEENIEFARHWLSDWLARRNEAEMARLEKVGRMF